MADFLCDIFLFLELVLLQSVYISALGLNNSLVLIRTNCLKPTALKLFMRNQFWGHHSLHQISEKKGKYSAFINLDWIALQWVWL